MRKKNKNYSSSRNNLKCGTTEYEGAFYCSFFYILAECPIRMSTWEDDGIDFIIYAKLMTALMSKTREVFVEESHNECANWLSLKFKSKSQTSIEAEKRELMNE
ncbi:hypothetical protein [Xenorhabdus mauleonii]|nr:hypothetical protein [Xenorhabdus mauleonii]